MHLLLPLLPLLGFVLRTLQLALRVVSPFWLLGLCLISLSGRALSVLAQSGWYQARRNLVLAGLILSASCYASPVRAQCVALEASAPLPMTVKADQCFELQGGNVLTDHYVIAGQLYVKAGRSATLAQRASLTVTPGGVFELRGQLELQPQAQIIVQDQGKLTSSGLMYFASPSALQGQGSATLRNIGRMVLEPGAYISLRGASSLRTSGMLTLNNALISLSGESKLTNHGTIHTEQQALLNIQGQAQFTNRGMLELTPYATLALDEQAQLINKNPFSPKGHITLSAQALWDNDALVKLAPSSSLKLRGRAQLLSEHTIESSGTILLSENARLLNRGTLALTSSAQLTAADYAVIINEGTFRNDGGRLQLEHAANFVNQNIISGEQSRTRIERKHAQPHSAH